MSDQTDWPTTTGDEVHDKFLQAIHARLGFFGPNRPAEIDYKNGDLYCGTHDDVEMIVKLEPQVAGNGQHPFKVTILKENASFIKYVIEAAAELQREGIAVGPLETHYTEKLYVE